MDGRYNGKRLHERDLGDRNGRQKRHNQGNYNNKDLVSAPFLPQDLSLPLVTLSVPDDAVFRILCPGPKIGGVIGKGGNIIKNLRQESGAKIKIADAIPGVVERVIIISPADQGSERGRGKDSKNHNTRGRDTRIKKRDNIKEGDRKDKDSSYKNGDELTPTQEALFKIHACIFAVVDISRGDGCDKDEGSSQQIITRLLVPNNQIGCLFGKGGKIIEQMRESTGAQIRVLPKDQLPGCALPTDELVQISGDVGVSKKALKLISSRLQENPPRDQLQSFVPPGSTFASMSDYLQKDSYGTKRNGRLFNVGLGHLEGSGWNFNNGTLPLEQQDNRRNKEGRDPGTHEIIFRLLCPSDKIGSVIGKGGSIIHNLRKETGARIKIADAVLGSHERVIIVSANEVTGDSFSPALEAMIQVHSRTTCEMGGDKDGVATIRLLVPINQIGCILGKGGSIIAEMRKATRANICILPKDTLPRCAQEIDELVQELQIVGDSNVAQDALFQVMSRLRNNAFKESGSEVGRSNGKNHDIRLSLPSLNMMGENYNNTYDFSRRMESNSPSASVFTLPRMNMAGAIHTSSGFGNLSSNPDVWGIGGGGGLSSLPNFGSGPSHLIQPLTGAFGGGSSRPTSNFGASLSTMSTIEVHIPNTSVGSVIGKGGSNIAHIRQLSGAKVKLHNSEQGAKDRVLELSGTQDQTDTAQNLVQAYMQSSINSNGLISTSIYAT